MAESTQKQPASFPGQAEPAGKDPNSRGDPGKIIRLAVPISLESVFQMGFNFVDQIIVGYLGAGAVASVGLSNSIASIALLLYASAGVGAGVMVARAFGRKDMDEVSRVAMAGQVLSGILGLFTAISFVALSQPILQLVGADAQLAEDAKSYFQLYAISTAPMILSSVTSAVFRSLDDSRTPMIITGSAVALNTALGFMLVLGFGPVPKFGVAGAGLATLISQSCRCLALMAILYTGKKELTWLWPGRGSKIIATGRKLVRLTAPIALSEVLWGTSTFIYTVVFTRLGTTALAASQVSMSLENVFIVVSAGFGPAAVAVIGQALGVGSVKAAKASAWQTIRFGLITAVVLGVLYAASSTLLPVLYPKVGKDVLQLAFWGVILMATTQPVKVLSSVLGNGVLASGGDTRFVLIGNLAGTYAVGLPAAIGLGLLAPFGFYGIFAAKILEEVVKMTCFLVRFQTGRWYKSALKEARKKEEEP